MSDLVVSGQPQPRREDVLGMDVQHLGKFESGTDEIDLRSEFADGSLSAQLVPLGTSGL
jgi:hypothetical protein